MNFKEDIKPVSYIKSHTAEIIKKINKTHNPVIITQNGEAKAVFIDTESYQRMRDAIALMKILLQGEEEADKNELTENKELFSKFDKKFTTRK